MPPFRKILATTAFCLAALGCSSCVTTVNKYVWNRAKIVDEAYWVADARNIELYRVGDIVYARGFIGPARGEQDTSDIPARILVTHGGAGPCFNPVREKGKPVYIRVNEGYQELKKELADNRRRYPESYREDVFFVHWNAPKYSPHLTELPPGAVKLRERCRSTSHIGKSSGYEPRTDAHQYYAYPLGALTAVAVDVPLSIAGNVLLLGAAVVTLPCACVYNIYDYCTQEAPAADSSSDSSQ